MIPVQFDYIAPERLADAVQLLKVRAGASALAGGHNLLVDLKHRRVAPTLLVDLRKIPSCAISVAPKTAAWTSER